MNPMVAMCQLDVSKFVQSKHCTGTVDAVDNNVLKDRRLTVVCAVAACHQIYILGLPSRLCRTRIHSRQLALLPRRGRRTGQKYDA
jgi:hypothetical protein